MLVGLVADTYLSMPIVANEMDEYVLSGRRVVDGVGKIYDLGCKCMGLRGFRGCIFGVCACTNQVQML